MTYPFEQVKNHTNAFINLKDKEQYDNLRELVISYDDVGVNKWFQERNEWLKVKGKNNLAKAIGYATYFFSVKSPLGVTKETLEELEYKQLLILLKHFKLEDQLILLTQNFKMESEDVFSFIFKTAKEQKKEDLFYNSRILLDPLFAIYSRHDFDKLKRVESIIEKNMVDLESNKVAFLFDNGGSYFKVKNSYFLTDQIILNYSDEKRDFIMSYGKEIPLKDKAYQFLEDITQDYKERDWISKGDMDTLEQITKHVSMYIKAILYFDLNNKYPDKNKVNNNIKKI